jgi:uncharacterized protein YegL
MYIKSIFKTAIASTLIAMVSCQGGQKKQVEKAPAYQVYNLIILDESGSMQSIKVPIVNGFNKLVQSIKEVELQYPEQEHFISLVSFNGRGLKVLHSMDSVSKLKEINSSQYQPNSGTPLFDAVGFSVNALNDSLKTKTDYKVLVTIMTDGEENASNKFSGNDIKMLVDTLKQQNWTFTYIGTDHDIESIAKSLSIDNKLYFDKTQDGINQMFEKEKKARDGYSRKIREKKDERTDYYK